MRAWELMEVATIKLGGSKNDLLKGKMDAFMSDYMNGTEPHPMDRGARLFGPVGLTVSPFSDVIHISDIRTYQDQGKGHGTSALNFLKKLADEHMVTLSGTAKAYSDNKDHIQSTSQLKQWYKKNGFEILGNDIIYDPTEDDEDSWV